MSSFKGHKDLLDEIRALLKPNCPSRKELKRRREFVAKIDQLRATAVRTAGTFPTAEEMIREDRDR